MNDISVTLIVLVLNGFITVAVTLIGWLGKELWNQARRNYEELRSRFEQLNERLDRLERQVQDNRKEVQNLDKRLTSEEAE